MSCLSFPRFPSSYIPYPSILVSYPPFLFHSFLFVFHTHLTSFLVVRIYPPTAHLGFMKATVSRNRSKVVFYFPVSFIELGIPMEAAPQSGFDSFFLEWRLIKPSPRSSSWPPTSTTKHSGAQPEPQPALRQKLKSFWPLSTSWEWSSSFPSPAGTYLCNMLSIVTMRSEQKGGVQAWTHHTTLIRSQTCPKAMSDGEPSLRSRRQAKLWACWNVPCINMLLVCVNRRHNLKTMYKGREANISE